MHSITEKIQKQSYGFFVHLALILVNIGLSIFIITDDYRTPLDGFLILAVLISSLLIMIGSFVCGMINGLTIPMLSTVFIITLSIGFTDFTMVYYDDCTQINKINPSVSVVDCISFIINNPDSTGMQVIEAFEQEQEIETNIDITILNRQFNP